MRFRNCLGMIWSVSTLTLSSGTTLPLCLRNGCMINPRCGYQRCRYQPSKFPIPDVGEVTGDGCGCRHHRTDEVRATSATLPAFEIAIAGRSAAFSGLQDIRIHAETHRAPRFTPFETGIEKDAVQSFLFGDALDGLRSWDHHRAYIRIDMLSFGHACRCPQVFDARVGARSDEDAVNGRSEEHT